MKNRKNLLLIVIVFVIMLIPKSANAIGICGADTFNKYKTDALKIQINYDLYKDDNNKAYFKATALNVNEDFIIKFDGVTYKAPKGSTTIKFDMLLNQQKTYYFSIYTDTSSKECPMAMVGQKKITTPKYNYYSENDNCVEYEEFPLCDKYYEGEIKSYEYFIGELIEYKKTLNNDVEEYKDDRSLIQKFIDLCSDNIEITVTIIAIIVIIIAIFIGKAIYKKAKRVKIRL